MRAACLAMLLAAAPVAAEEAAPKAQPAWAGMRRWFENLKKGLAESGVEAHHQRGRGAIAVAAVRGAGQAVEDPGKPYFKSGAADKKARAARKERSELTAAVDLVLGGKAEEALAAFQAFEKAHPDSALLADCRQAREQLERAAAPQADEAAPTPPPAGEAPPAPPPAGEAPPGPAAEAAKAGPKAEPAPAKAPAAAPEPAKAGETKPEATPAAGAPPTP